MQHFPIYLRVAGRRIAVAGAGPTAVAKIRLLLKTEARVSVFGADPDPQVPAWNRAGKLRHLGRPLQASDLANTALLYCATGDPERDARIAGIGRSRGVPVNVVDNLHESDFITPAIVDRDPVTVAIGTEGAAPVLAREIKATLEAEMPVSLGPLARVGQASRRRAERIPAGRARRGFWREFFFLRGPRAFARGGAPEAEVALSSLLDETRSESPLPGWVSLVGGRSGGPGTPDAQGEEPAA